MDFRLDQAVDDIQAPLKRSWVTLSIQAQHNREQISARETSGGTHIAQIGPADFDNSFAHGERVSRQHSVKVIEGVNKYVVRFRECRTCEELLDEVFHLRRVEIVQVPKASRCCQSNFGVLIMESEQEIIETIRDAFSEDSGCTTSGVRVQFMQVASDAYRQSAMPANNSPDASCALTDSTSTRER
ncbi:hypothetical protein [Candidatus Poriferisodalis sp.]|uniref:hypothetical protein n=1 Tax=Candidatus Poriferisodalis sp. TaxID=3101277 RepID=UPI003B01C843